MSTENCDDIGKSNPRPYGTKQLEDHKIAVGRVTVGRIRRFLHGLRAKRFVCVCVGGGVICAQDEVKGGWILLQSEKLYDLYCSLIFASVTKRMSVRWASI